MPTRGRSRALPAHRSLLSDNTILNIALHRFICYVKCHEKQDARFIKRNFPSGIGYGLCSFQTRRYKKDA